MILFRPVYPTTATKGNIHYGKHFWSKNWLKSLKFYWRIHGKVETSVKDLNDEVCPDEVYENEPRKSFSVGTQTLECGMALQRTSRKSDFDFYTLQYDDSD